MSTRYKVYAFTDENSQRPVVVYEEELTDNAGGGGASNLSDLSDVNLSSLLDGEILSWDSSTSRWVNTTPSSGGGGSSGIVTNAIFVDPDNGNDSTGTGAIDSPYQTLQTAINSATNGEAVVSLGSGDFSEDVTCIDGVDVIAPYSNLTLNDGNQLTLAACRIIFRRLIRTSGTGPMIVSDNQSEYAIVDVFEINDTGSGDTISASNSSPLTVRFSQVFIGNGNTFIVDTSASQHFHLQGEDIYLSGANSTIVELSNGATGLMTVHHVQEIGSGAGTCRAFNIINGDINATFQDISATTLADISADGRLNISAQEAEGTVNNSNGIYTYYYNEFAGSTAIGTDLSLRLAASSYILENLAGNSGAFLTLGSSGAIVPASLNQGSTVWSDDTEAFTDVSTTTEQTVYELTVDQNFDAGSAEFELTISYPYYREHIVRLYHESNLLDEQVFEGTTSPLTFSGVLAITSSILSGETFSVTLQTDVAPSFEPNRSDIQDGGFLRVTKSGQGFGGIGLYSLITNVESPYDISGGEQVIVDTSGGAVTINAPSAGSFVVADVGGNASVNNITINFGSKSLLFNGSISSSYNHNLDNTLLTFIDDGTNYRRID